VDWDDNFVWGPWQVPEDRTDIERLHHDYWKILNTQLNKYTYISLIYYTATNDEIWAAGGDPSIDYVDEGRNTRQDAIIEVDPDSEEIIWQWRFMDHTVQDRDATWANFGVIADNPGKNDAFWRTDQARSRGQDEGVVADWHHCNSIHYNEELDHIAVNAKHWSEFYVVDHGATFVPGDPAASIAAAAGPAGDFAYRFGNPSAYQQGDAPGFLDEGHQQMYGSHNIHWIREGLPGGGNFIIFNNDCYDPTGRESEVLEINPFIMDGDGNTSDNYVNPPMAGYDANSNSNQIVWSYSSETYGNSFYSGYISGMERQPNGNTLICAGAHGHFFEVTPEGEVVWEYINPVQDGPVARTTFTDADGRRSFSVFRVRRYSADHPALMGRDLTPRGPITNNLFNGAMERFQGSTAARARAGGGDIYDPDDPYYPY
jgi:hypothetical protein